MLLTQISRSISLCIVRLFSVHIQLPLSAFVTINNEAESVTVKAHRKAKVTIDLGLSGGLGLSLVPNPKDAEDRWLLPDSSR